ncbi:chymotrypsin-2-like [Chironomus tepperi]|uniref:chymotrypsin-2-like n=1 Tax=Chironomus tepperi TaxID=113505 RepID=UPI00391FC270
MLRQVLIICTLVAVAFAGTIRDSDFQSRIVGGAPAVDGQFPYQISLRSFPALGHFCGGSIISEHWTLSAAHCTINRTPANTRIVTGTVLLNGGAAPVQREVSRIVNHPNYDSALIAQDVCVVRVTVPFVWTQNVQPIRVGSEFIGGGVTAIVSGWGGTTVNGGAAPNNLQWIAKQTITNADCRVRMGTANERFVIDSKICTFTQAGQGICQGDSGGPLTAAGSVIGIVSWNIPCARGFPDGFDRVSHWHSWINENAVG